MPTSAQSNLPDPKLTDQPWWDVGQGWRVHLGLDQFWCLAYNTRSGDVTTWSQLIPQLYPETKHGDWLRLVTDAIANGKRD